MAEVIFDFDDLEGKELDDVAENIIKFLYDELGIEITDYWIEV